MQPTTPPGLPPEEAPVTVDESALCIVRDRFAQRLPAYLGGVAAPDAGLRVDLRALSSASTYPLYLAEALSGAGQCVLRAVVKFAPIYGGLREGRTEYDNLRAMYTRLGPAGPLRVARPLDYYQDVNALLTEHVGGERFSRQVLAGATLAPGPAAWERLCATAKRCGAWLRVFHEITATGDGDPFDTEVCDAIAQQLGWLRELGLTPGAAGLAAEALRVLRGGEPRLRVAIARRHGDFSPANVHVLGEAICVFDLSYASHAAVFDDLAHFLVTLDTMNPYPRYWKFSRRTVKRLREPFLAGYFADRAGALRGGVEEHVLLGYCLKHALTRCLKQRRSVATRGRAAGLLYDRLWLRGPGARLVSSYARRVLATAPPHGHYRDSRS